MTKHLSPVTSTEEKEEEKRRGFDFFLSLSLVIVYDYFSASVTYNAKGLEAQCSHWLVMHHHEICHTKVRKTVEAINYYFSLSLFCL
jgi:hypothetical protein